VQVGPRHRLDHERARERREHRLDTPLVDIDARIASAISAERQTVIPALRAAVDELLHAERQHVKSEMTQSLRSLELQIAKLGSAVSALQVALVAGRGKTIDLPNPLRVN
jgi:D-alanine-D-alanine ligase-like ATP-grasp enzyme